MGWCIEHCVIGLGFIAQPCMEVRVTEFIQEIFWFWYLNANFLLTHNRLFLEPLCHYQWPAQVQVLPVGSHYHNLIGCGSRSEEGPGFACEKTLLSVLDKRGCLKGSRDAGVLLLQAESTSVVCIVAAASSLDFEVFFFVAPDNWWNCVFTPDLQL